jgi:hypothetical protein
MTLDEAISDLHQQGLPCPSAISVFFLYQKKETCYFKDESFDIKFNELLKVQKTIQENCLSPL